MSLVHSIEERADAAAPPSSDVLARLTRWFRHRSPVVTRRQHHQELASLTRAAEELCEAVQGATSASVLAMEQWRKVAKRYLHERDEARQEVERLRATVASLVLSGALQKGELD